MQPGPLPLFPLNVVLFPRTPLALHIFEPRYREMFAEILAEEGREFGVVLAHEKGIVNLGCAAVVERVVARNPDGSIDLVAVGRRRFEVLELNQDRSFLRATVRFYEDTDLAPVTPELRRRALEHFRAAGRHLSLPEGIRPDLADPQLSFQLAQMLEDLEFRQRLLALRSEVRRLEVLIEYLPGYVARQGHIEQVKAVAPRNGRAHGAVTEH